TLVDSLVCVESRATALAPQPAGSNDLVEPIRTGKIGPDHIHAELGELVVGAKPGRTRNEQITPYKSAGVAVQDAVAAVRVLEAGCDVRSCASSRRPACLSRRGQAGCQITQAVVQSIDPAAKRVETDVGAFEGRHRRRSAQGRPRSCGHGWPAGGRS